MEIKTNKQNMDTIAKILVVDDESAICDALKEVLEYESYAVQTIQSAPEALKRKIQSPYTEPS